MLPCAIKMKVTELKTWLRKARRYLRGFRASKMGSVTVSALPNPSRSPTWFENSAISRTKVLASLV